MQWVVRHRRVVLAAICLFWTAVVILGRMFPSVPFVSLPWSGEQNFEDILRREGRKTPTRNDFVFVGIDEVSKNPPVGDEEIAGNRALQLMKEHQPPWSRELWQIFLDKMFSAGARLVLFDMIFDAPNNADPVFRGALDKYRDRVVIGCNFEAASGQLVVPNANLIPTPAFNDDRVGFVNFWADPHDGRVRAAPFVVSERQLIGQEPIEGDDVYTSLSARALGKLGQANEVPHDFRARVFRFGSVNAYEPISLWTVFWPQLWQYKYEKGGFFKDKVVILGASAQISHDVVDTPVDPSMLGPALHLHAIAAALAHQYLTGTSLWVGYALVVAAGALAWTLIALGRRPVFSLLGLIVLTVAYLGAARLFYDLRGFFLVTVPVLSNFLLSGLCSLGLEYAIERLEKLRTRRTLERYVSRNLVKEILENPDSYYHSLLGVRVPATILFSDLIGFTTLSEKADPEELVKQLNQYLTKMTTVVFENGGTLDKFIGDAIMAVWGNVHSFGVAEDARNAVRTAYGMRCALQKLNESWRNEGRMGLGMGIGINHGEVIVGNIGSQERMDPTVIGDAVNLASRLEALTRTYAVDILIGASAAELVRDDFHLRSVARVQVKGKTQPVEVWSLLGPREAGLDSQLLKWMECYEEGIIKFRGRDFQQAKIRFSQFLEFYPEDFLAKMYLERALEYEQEPPDEAWNAVEIFKKK